MEEMKECERKCNALADACEFENHLLADDELHWKAAVQGYAPVDGDRPNQEVRQKLVPIFVPLSVIARLGSICFFLSDVLNFQLAHQKQPFALICAARTDLFVAA